jgi:hypothetical protein
MHRAREMQKTATVIHPEQTRSNRPTLLDITRSEAGR